MDEQILIIEDDEAIARVLQRTLVYEGYTVDMATDGPEGLAKARAVKPDLVILMLGCRVWTASRFANGCARSRTFRCSF